MTLTFHLTLEICSVCIMTVRAEPFPKRQILHASKLREFADENFKFDKNGKKVFQKGRNTVGEKGEIARYEQFLLFPHSVSKDIYCKHVKTRACLGKG